MNRKQINSCHTYNASFKYPTFTFTNFHLNEKQKNKRKLKTILSFKIHEIVTIHHPPQWAWKKYFIPILSISMYYYYSTFYSKRLFNNRKVGFCYADLIRKKFFLLSWGYYNYLLFLVTHTIWFVLISYKFHKQNKKKRML